MSVDDSLYGFARNLTKFFHNFQSTISRFRCIYDNESIGSYRQTNGLTLYFNDLKCKSRTFVCCKIFLTKASWQCFWRHCRFVSRIKLLHLCSQVSSTNASFLHLLKTEKDFPAKMTEKILKQKRFISTHDGEMF